MAGFLASSSMTKFSNSFSNFSLCILSTVSCFFTWLYSANKLGNEILESSESSFESRIRSLSPICAFSADSILSSFSSNSSINFSCEDIVELRTSIFSSAFLLSSSEYASNCSIRVARCSL